MQTTVSDKIRGKEMTTSGLTNTRKYIFVGIALGVWAVATLLIRLVGQYLFDPGNTPMIVGLFIAAIPVMALLTYPLYYWFKIPAEERPHAAIILAFPGMILDVLVITFFQDVFPNIDPAADKLYGAWLMFCYMLVILSGILFNRRVS